ARGSLDAGREAVERDLLLEAPLLVVERADARAAVGARRRVRVDRRCVRAQRLARPPPPQRQLADVFGFGVGQIHASPSFARSFSRSATTLLKRLRTVGIDRPIAAATSSNVISSTK